MTGAPPVSSGGFPPVSGCFLEPDGFRFCGLPSRKPCDGIRFVSSILPPGVRPKGEIVDVPITLDRMVAP